MTGDRLNVAPRAAKRSFANRKESCNPIFPYGLSVKPIHPSQCRDYNALRPLRLSRGDFLTSSPPPPQFLGSGRLEYQPARRLDELWLRPVLVLFPGIQHSGRLGQLCGAHPEATGGGNASHAGAVEDRLSSNMY